MKQFVLGVLCADSTDKHNLQMPLRKKKEETEKRRLKMEQNVHTPTDIFKRHFKIPSLRSNLVFDFEYFDDDNRVSTPESIPLNSELHLKSRGSWQGASVLETHKTTLKDV